MVMMKAFFHVKMRTQQEATLNLERVMQALA